jgi:CO dehydrogenase/acetyl-CoA synthase gamma subunit (corrinoid Fe-S protein)
MSPAYINGSLTTITGPVPIITTTWSAKDVLSTIKIRWAIGRMNYKVEPGIYAIGNPDESTHVFVTSNF